MESDHHSPNNSKRKNWIATLSTNSRYKMSNIPGMPWFGLEKVSLKSAGDRCVLLGTLYRPSVHPLLGDDSEVWGHPKKVALSFMEHFKSICWVTYRSDFRPLGVENFTSDVGWGCTIRVAQMILLTALKRCSEDYDEVRLLELIQENTELAPYSLHRFCEFALQHQKHPGDHFSPSCVSHIVCSLLEDKPFPGLKCMVFMDSVIFKDQLLSCASGVTPTDLSTLCLCLSCANCYKQQWQWPKGMLVFLPVMLGLKRIQTEFYDFVKFILTLRQCIGIIGGKPKSALYFVGHQADSLIFLDPHYVQTACQDVSEVISKSHTYHCESPKLLPLAKAESSMSIGFYFDSLGSFVGFQDKIRANSEIVKGILSIDDRTPTYEALSDDDFIVIS